MQPTWFGRCAFGLIMAWGVTTFAGPPEPVSEEVRALARANNAFAVSLLHGLPREGRNLSFSPASLSASLAMIHAGARGDTADQIARALHLGDLGPRVHSDYRDFLKAMGGGDRREAGCLKWAGALWAPLGVEIDPSFEEALRRDYRAECRRISFSDPLAASHEINAWVADQTRGRIRQIVAPGSFGPRTRLVLTDAIYFKGTWANRFPKDRTWDEVFHAPGGEARPVPFMHLSGVFPFWEDEHLQALELPYGDGSIVMDLFLTRSGEALAGLEATLTTDTLDAWFSRLKKQRVGIALPKFRLLTTQDFREILSDLGMRDAFRDGADFSGMTPDGKGLFLSSLIHKAFIDVDEEGTEATAATVPTFTITSATTSWPTFRADHAFLFLIRDLRTGGILFLGRLARPPAMDARPGPLAATAHRDPRSPGSAFVLIASSLNIPYLPAETDPEIAPFAKVMAAPPRPLRILWSSDDPAPRAIQVTLHVSGKGRSFDYPIDGPIAPINDEYRVDLTAFARRLADHADPRSPALFPSDLTSGLGDSAEVFIRPVLAPGSPQKLGDVTKARGTIKISYEPIRHPR